MRQLSPRACGGSGNKNWSGLLISHNPTAYSLPGKWVYALIRRLPVSGPQCNIPMKNIPFKPLSERMLEEPFWLGLITVTVVLILIGICYLLKKHLPDYLEKFISEDPESGKLVEKSLHHQGQMSSNLWQKSSHAPYVI